MRSMRMFIDNKVVIFADISDKVDLKDLTNAMKKAMDKFVTTRIEMSVPKSGMGDAWLIFIEKLCEANGIESAALLSKRRSPPLPDLRAIACAAWQGATNEMVTRTAPRINMDYSSVIVAIDKLNDRGKTNMLLRAKHEAAIRICQEVFKESETAKAE